MGHHVADLAHRLARDAEAVCRHYLSNGRREGRYWLVGDVRNTPGRSLFVRLRGPEFWEGASIHLPAEFEGALRRPEQWFFFAPFALAVGALAIKLSSGHITIAWSLVGVGVFLFALAVGERSYRLAGLALLLVCVVKIVLMDVWQLSPPERYTTLIVLGLALLAVSFLYTRFGKTIRKFL